MDEAVAREFLRHLGSTKFARTEKYLNGNCPFAPWRHKSGVDNNPSFGVRLDGSSHYTCFSCGSKGDLMSLVLELGHFVNQGLADYAIGDALALLSQGGEDTVIHEWKPKTLPGEKVFEIPEWWISKYPLATTSIRASKYLIERRILTQTAKVLDLRYDPHRNLLCFPMREFRGFLAGMRGRRVQITGDPFTDEPKFHDYRYMGKSNSGIVWLGENWVDFTKPLVVVEGTIDYARVFALYTNVVAAQTMKLSIDKVKRLSGAWNLILFFDNDMAGNQGASRIEDILGKECLIERVEYPDGTKDAGAMSDDQIVDLLKPHVGV